MNFAFTSSGAVTETYAVGLLRGMLGYWWTSRFCRSKAWRHGASAAADRPTSKW